MFLTTFYKLNKVPVEGFLEVKLMELKKKILNYKWGKLFYLLQPLTFTQLNDDNQNYQINCPLSQLAA